MAIERYVRQKWIHGTAQGRLVCRYGNLAAKLILEAKGREPFRCPICFYDGPFLSFSASSVPRPNAMCPGCGALERHRLQWLAVSRLAERTQFHKMRLLHVAPEAFFARRFRPMFREYVAIDLERSDVDVQADLTKLPMADGSFDIVYASHVLEHVQNDRQALAEIRRILAPGGLAILPVPILGLKTVEYPEANPAEEYHVRQPGVDYYDRYDEYFPRVERFISRDFDPLHQLFIYEDRTKWPTPTMPLRQPMAGIKHEDIVPICYC